MFMQRQVDGLILLNGHVPEEYLLEIASQIPLIIVGSDIPALKTSALPLMILRLPRLQPNTYPIRTPADCSYLRFKKPPGCHRPRRWHLMALREAGIEPNPNLIIEGDFTEPSG